jgi:hypothetical protein
MMQHLWSRAACICIFTFKLLFLTLRRLHFNIYAVSAAFCVLFSAYNAYDGASHIIAHNSHLLSLTSPSFIDCIL